MTTKDVTFRDAGLRSPLLRSVNAGGALLRRLGLERRPMRAEGVLARARKSTGLEDFGDDSWREGLDVLLESMEREADLTSFGRFVRGAMLSQFLGIRLQVVDWAKRHPAIREEKIRAPWVIAGLPRTGTTLLSHLLDLDPKVRSLLGWEATSPMPPATPAGREHDPRIAAAEKIGARLDRLIPPLKAMHPLEPRLPTECVTLFACDFRSLLFTTQAPVPAYAAWLDAADTRPAYAFHRLVLQALQADFPASRWNLKTPQHLWSFDALFATYPDARVIWTHRDPRKVVPSVASLNMAFYRTFSRDPDPIAAGREWNRELAVGVERGMAFDAAAEDPKWCCHLQYEDLMRDPVAAVRRVYAHFGDELDPAQEERIRTFLAQRPQSAFGRHRYDATDFGLRPEAIDETFAAYRQRYNVPREVRD